jgi:hypothetical protein
LARASRGRDAEILRKLSMFGFSLSKLLVLAVIVGAVMIGFRLFGRGGPQGGSQGATQGGKQSGSGRAETKPEPDAVDTEYDAETDTYVVRDKNAKQD